MPGWRMPLPLICCKNLLCSSFGIYSVISLMSVNSINNSITSISNCITSFPRNWPPISTCLGRARQTRSDSEDVAELHRKRMVKDMADKGKLRNCIPICDVSGSMAGTPLKVSVALGLLISELSEEPWKGRVITFSETPLLHIVSGDTLKEKTRFVKGMKFGRTTDFKKVFDQILRLAVEGKLEPEKMIKRLFVFSDMEFGVASAKYKGRYVSEKVFYQALAKSWETDYEVICAKFQMSGYGSCIPEIVFWNLRDSRSMPVPSTQKGVALVSGFSKNIMKLFLEGDGTVDPEAVMAKAISGEEYNKLMIFD